MANSYMQMIFIDSDDQALHTNVGAAQETDAQTWATFRSYRRLGVSFKEAAFLLDYYNRKGDLADTIALSKESFRAITGERVRTEAEYRKIDDEYWDKARSEYAATSAPTKGE